jgi:hypothetical protein
VYQTYHSNNIKYYCIEIQKARKRAFCLAINIDMLFDNNIVPIQQIKSTSVIGDNSLTYEIIQRNLDKDLKICILTTLDLSNCDYDKINQSMDFVYINVGDHMCYIKFPLPELTIPYKVLINEYQIIKPNHSYFPYWLIASRLFAEQDVITDTNKKYKVSCLNRNPRKERIFNFVNLKKLIFSHEIKFSFFKTYPCSNNTVIQPNTLEGLDEHIIELFNLEFDQLPISPNDEYSEQDSIKSLDISGYNDTMLNIITETYHNTGLLSEKTFKPIRAEQLFLMAGPANAILQLKKLGFDTYDDLINHSYYDSEPNWQIRILKMQEILVRIYNNIDAIHKQTINRRKNNRQHLLSEILKNQIVQPILQDIR